MDEQITGNTAGEQYPPSYRYRTADLQVIWQTSVPKDDEAALGYFHAVVRFSPDHKPVYCERIERPASGGEHYVMLPEIFDPVTMETKPFGIDQL